MLKTWFEIPLWQRVVTALILGVLTGWAWGPDAESIKWIGDFFIKAIKMLVVPLIFFSLVSGVAAIGDLRKLGAVGGRALLLFVVCVFEQAMGKGTWQRSWIKSLAGFLFGVAARPVVPTVILDTKLQRRLSEAVVP